MNVKSEWSEKKTGENLEKTWEPRGCGRPLGWLAPALSLWLQAEVPAVVL